MRVLGSTETTAGVEDDMTMRSVDDGVIVPEGMRSGAPARSTSETNQDEMVDRMSEMGTRWGI